MLYTVVGGLGMTSAAAFTRTTRTFTTHVPTGARATPIIGTAANRQGGRRSAASIRASLRARRVSWRRGREAFVGGAFAIGSKLRGKISADGSSTVGPYVTSAAGDLPEAEPRRPRHRGHLRHGWRLRALLTGRDGFPTPRVPSSRARRRSAATTACGTRPSSSRTTASRSSSTRRTRGRLPDGRPSSRRSGTPARRWTTGRTSDRRSRTVPLKLFGPGTDSGTFDFFTEHINGKAKRSRSDYVGHGERQRQRAGRRGHRGGLGYFGYSYYEENQGKLKLLG